MSNPIKIMLVEDDPLLVNLYNMAFKDAGFDVETAFDGKAALEKLVEMERKPTLVLSDIMMPKMNGLEFLKKIKEVPELKNIPVILLTNMGKDHDVEEGLGLGAVAYIIKSEYLPKEVVAKVKEIVFAYEHGHIPEVKTRIKE